MGTILQIIGAVSITIGIGIIFPPAGIIVGGISFLLFGIALERSN